MKSPTITLITGLGVASAHTVFTTLFINNVDQGDATCVRMPMTPSNATYPVNDLTARDMACGYGGSQGVARVCPVPQGSTLSFQYRTYADASVSGSIDSSHKGPCAVYMKSVTSAIYNTAVGGGWFKIMELGYDNNTSQWCTDKLILTNGTFNATIPDNLAGGYYLVRSEILSLHQADKTPPNPQFYVGCAQIFLSSTETAVPNNTVSIPGFTNISDPSVLFNIYIPKWPYHPPGPPIYNNFSAVTQVQPVELQEEGLLPKNVVAVNANWWGIELDSYTDEPGCWNASTNCFAQAAMCYNTAPPTGSKGCHTWENKCMSIQAACNMNNFTGPPDKGKIITSILYSAVAAVAAVVAGSSPSRNAATMTDMTSGYRTLAIDQSTSSFSQDILTTSLKSLPSISKTSSLSSSAAAADDTEIPVNLPTSSHSNSATTKSITLSTYTSWGTHRPTTPAILATPAMFAEFTSSAAPLDIATIGLSIDRPVFPTTTLASSIPSLDIVVKGPLTSETTASINHGVDIIASPNIPNTLPPSTDGQCGQGSGVTCIGSIYGQCCSVHGWCGNDNNHCGFMNCQAEQGPCEVNFILAVTPNGTRAPTAVTRLPRRKYRNAWQHQV